MLFCMPCVVLVSCNKRLWLLLDCSLLRAVVEAKIKIGI